MLPFVVFYVLICSACQSGDSQSIKTRLNPVLAKANASITTNPDSSILLADYVLRISEQSSSLDSFYIESQYIKAQAIREKGFYDKSNTYLKELIHYVEPKKDTPTLAKLNFKLGTWYYNNNSPALAKDYLTQSAILYGYLGNRSIQADALYFTGVSDLNLGNYESSEKNLMQSYRYYKRSNDSYKLGLCYLNLGNLLHEIKKEDEALQYYLESIVQFQLSNDSNSLANVYVNLGLLQKSKGNLDSALYYYQISDNYNINQTNKLAQIINRYNIINIYIRQQKFDLATTNLNWCLNECLTHNVADGIPRIYCSYSIVYLKQHDYKKGLLYIDTALVMADSMQVRPLKKQFLDVKIELLDSLGRGNEMLAITKLRDALSDSLNTDEVNKKLAADKKINEERKKPAQYSFIKKTTTNPFSKLKIGLILASSLVLFVVFYFYRKRANTQ